MPFADFVNNPKGYIASHQVYLNNSDLAAGAMVAGAAAAAGGGMTMQFTRNGNVIELQRNLVMQPVPNKKDKVKMFVGAKRPRRDYNVTAIGGADNGFRYLPFRQNHCTYMHIDGAATMAMTGPLTGCTVSVGRDPAGVLYFFHSNDNTQHGAAARMTQLNTLHGAAGLCGVNVAALHLCEMTQQYNGMAFVWGRLRPGGVWKFYVCDHAIGANGATVSTNNLWATL